MTGAAERRHRPVIDMTVRGRRQVLTIVWDGFSVVVELAATSQEPNAGATAASRGAPVTWRDGTPCRLARDLGWIEIPEA
jgi:hypothetical protein